MKKKRRIGWIAALFLSVMVLGCDTGSEEVLSNTQTDMEVIEDNKANDIEAVVKAENIDESENKPMATVTPEPTIEPTPKPTISTTPRPTLEPTPEPIAEPTPQPTQQPTPLPTPDVTPEPISEPTPELVQEVVPKTKEEEPVLEDVVVTQTEVTPTETQAVISQETVPADSSGEVATGSYAVNNKNGKIHMVGACSATGNGERAMKEPIYFNTYEEAEAYSVQIKPKEEKRKCGNCW